MPNYKELSAENKKFIHDNHKNLTVREISIELGFSQTTISNYFYRAGLSRKMLRKSWNQPEEMNYEKNGMFIVERYKPATI